MVHCTGRALAAAIVVVLWAAPAHATVTVERNLDLGIIPAGVTRLVSPTHVDAARFRVTLDGIPCAGGPANLRFALLPSELDNGLGATLGITFGATSARIEQESNPSNNATFDPGVGVNWAYSDFPAIVTLGASATAGPFQTIATYVPASLTLELTYRHILLVLCVLDIDVGIATLAAEVQAGVDVVATNGPLDLGMLFQGETITVPADDSGLRRSAQFATTGPSGLSWQFSVTTTDLAHVTQPDVLPLMFTNGLYGSTSPPVTSFVDGVVVPAGVHGSTLEVWLGYEVVVPPGAATGAYQGSITLTVDALLE